MPPVIVARDLYKCYPGFAPVLRGASITVEPGEMAAIMGPSGCGKSTMLHILGMLHSPDSGSLEILGTDVLTLDRDQTAAFRRGNMGFVMQASNLFEHSTVFENVEFPLIYENVPPQERWERVIRALELVHLSARVHYRSNRLSGGEQQRVAIARAMVNNPKILLADEPTGALDARTSRLIMENFRKLCHEGGVSMIMVTHDPKMADFCDSIYTLEDGILKCKKREPTPFSADTGENFLRPPEPVVRGALVATRFPDQKLPDLLELARRMHESGLLARIYSLTHNNFLGNPEGYALPLPVRHAGFWQRLGGYLAFFRHAKNSQSLWQIWRSLPPGGDSEHFSRIRAFANSRLLGRWGIEDNIQFFYAASALNVATSAWVAARLLKLPFAFAARPCDVKYFGAACIQKARDAAFVACPTQSVKNELLKIAPELPAEKILLLRPSLAVMPEEDEGETAMPPQPGKPLDILAMGPEASARGFMLVLDCASILKRMNFSFRLTFFTSKSFSRRWQVWKRGLRRNAIFAGSPKMDNIGEVYRTADLFVAFPPGGPGGSLSLPEYLCEAMAFGLPIVAAGVTSGMEEALKDGRNAVFCPENDATALAERISSLGKPERQKLGAAARQDINALLDTKPESRRLADLMAQAAGASERLKETAAERELPQA